MNRHDLPVAILLGNTTVMGQTARQQSIKNSLKRSLGGLKRYSLLVFLPLIFGFILVPVISNLVNRQMDSYGSLTSDFFKSRMTAEMDAVESVCDILKNDGRLKTFLAEDTVSLESERAMIARIAGSVERNSNIREIYLLDGVHGYIYSSQAAYIYSPENTVITSSEMASMSLENQEDGWHMTDQDGTFPYYLLSSSTDISGGVKSPEVRILAVFDIEQMKDIIRSIDAKGCAVFNDNGYVSPVIAAGRDIDWTSEESVSDVLGTRVRCFYSEDEGFRFVSALAYEDYRKPVNTIIRVFALYFAAVLIAGLIYLAIVSKRELDSWDELAALLPTYGEGSPGADRSFAGGTDIRENIKRSLLEYRKNINQYDYEQHSHIVRQLLKSRMTEPDTEIFARAGIPLDAAGYCVMSIYAEDYSDMMFDESGEISNIDYSRIVFRNVLESAAEARCSFATAGLGRVFAVIMCFGNSASEAPATALDIARKCADSVESNFGLNLHIAISSIISSLDSVGEAYRETEQLQEYMRFLEAETAIVTPDSLSGTADEFTNNGYTGQLHLLESMLEAEKYDYVPRMVSDILDSYVLPLKKNYRIAQNRTGAVACILAEAVLYSGKEQIDPISLSEKLRNADSATQLKEAAENVFSQLAAISSGSSEYDAVKLACRFIDENYSNPDLSAADISEAAGVSPQHLNRLFHKKLGIKVTAYLQRQRIKQAKILLQETDLPVAEVALKSGYNSQSTFSYNFRNQENIAPGAYREWLRERRGTL